LRNRGLVFEVCYSGSNVLTIKDAPPESLKYDANLVPITGELSGFDYITFFDPATGLHLGTLVDNIDEIEAMSQEVRARVCLLRHKKARTLMRLIDFHWSLIQLIVIDAALGEVFTTCSKMDWLLHHGEKYLCPGWFRTRCPSCHTSDPVAAIRYK
jgi:hypothetical protein